MIISVHMLTRKRVYNWGGDVKNIPLLIAMHHLYGDLFLTEFAEITEKNGFLILSECSACSARDRAFGLTPGLPGLLLAFL
jgi:hypothetical protein